MECLEAQQLISAAIDGESIDAEELALAKAHCAACEGCGAFVRALVAMRRAPAPEPPADLADRVVARVREEAAIAEAARAIAPQPEAGGNVIPLDEDSRERLRRVRLSRGQWVAVAATAAVVLVAAGFAAISGVRAIVAPTVRESAVGTVADAAQLSAEAPATSGAEKSAGATDGARFLAGTVPQYVTLGEDVYQYTSVVEYSVSSLAVAGTTTSALQSGESKERTAYTLPGGDSIAIETDTGEVFGFDLVTRTLAGRTYSLKARPVGGFGVWPQLPASIPEPDDADGTPTFTPLEDDLSGARLFVRAGSSAAEGIAVAPDSPADDPAASNPYWTWWEPVR